MNIAIDCISGASIGALNGCILSSAPDFATGCGRLQEVWEMLPEIKPLQAQPALLPDFSLLLSAGLQLNPKLFKEQLPETPDGVLSDTPLKNLMDEYLDLEQLQKSIPFYISVFEQ